MEMGERRLSGMGASGTLLDEHRVPRLLYGDPAEDHIDGRRQQRHRRDGRHGKRARQAAQMGQQPGFEWRGIDAADRAQSAHVLEGAELCPDACHPAVAVQQVIADGFEKQGIRDELTRRRIAAVKAEKTRLNA